MLLAHAHDAGRSAVLCLLLLVATVVLLVVGICEVAGLVVVSWAGRFGTLLAAAVLLAVYLLVC